MLTLSAGTYRRKSAAAELRERNPSPSNSADAATSTSSLARRLLLIILESSLGIVEERRGRICALLNLES